LLVGAEVVWDVAAAEIVELAAAVDADEALALLLLVLSDALADEALAEADETDVANDVVAADEPDESAVEAVALPVDDGSTSVCVPVASATEKLGEKL